MPLAPHLTFRQVLVAGQPRSFDAQDLPDQAREVLGYVRSIYRNLLSEALNTENPDSQSAVQRSRQQIFAVLYANDWFTEPCYAAADLPDEIFANAVLGALADTEQELQLADRFGFESDLYSPQLNLSGSGIADLMNAR